MATLSVVGMRMMIVCGYCLQTQHHNPRTMSRIVSPPGCHLSEHYLKSYHGVSVRMDHIASATANKGVDRQAL